MQRTAKFTWRKNAIPWISVWSSISHIMRTTLNPAYTLAVGVGRDRGSFEERTGLFCKWKLALIHPQAMETETCSRHENSGLICHQGRWCHFAFCAPNTCSFHSLPSSQPAQAFWEVLYNHCSQYPPPGLSWGLWFVSWYVRGEKKLSEKLGPALPTASCLPCTWSKCCWVVGAAQGLAEGVSTNVQNTLHIVHIIHYNCKETVPQERGK